LKDDYQLKTLNYKVKNN